MERDAEMEARLERLEGRVRALEARLRDRGVEVSNTSGRTARVRLAADGQSLEVE